MFAQYMGGRLFPKESLMATPNWEVVLPNNDQPIKDMEEAMKFATHCIWQRLSTLRGLAVFMAMKDRYKIPMLVEIDDDAFNVDSSNPGFMVLQPDKEAFEVFEHQMKLADGIIVSTEDLKNKYKRFNKNIHVIGNYIDLNVWKNVKKVKHSGIRIGFQGGMQHHRDLNILMPVLPKIIRKYKNVEFHFFGCMPECFKNIGIYHEPVIINDYPKNIGKINPDILVAPLYDNHMNRARSNLRALEAGAFGVPIVASKGIKLPYTEIINQCHGGFLAGSTDDWVEHLSMLIEDKALRIKMGTNLNNEVKMHYSIKDGAKTYADLLKSL